MTTRSRSVTAISPYKNQDYKYLTINKLYIRTRWPIVLEKLVRRIKTVTIYDHTRSADTLPKAAILDLVKNRDGDVKNSVSI